MVLETILIGLVAALLYTEVTDLYPGGLIVPAYLAIHLDQPLKVLVTILIALLALLSFRFLSVFFLLFGKRRFLLMILLAIFWGQLWSMVWPGLFPASLELQVIGWIVPGLLANNLERQKFVPTLASLVTVTVVTHFIVRLVSYL
ncbi:MAG: poly-gamma-glutamate biosynthesis protein PgsC [Candidatus Aminicenantales bacterium]